MIVKLSLYPVKYDKIKFHGYVREPQTGGGERRVRERYENVFKGMYLEKCFNSP